MKYLGVDFGLKRVGLAISEGIFASPYKIVEGKGLKSLAEKVAGEAKKGNFDQVIVGMPEGKIGNTVKGFIRLLEEEGLAVKGTDETLSTLKAQNLMVSEGISQKKRRLTDAHAAAWILQNYLDSL